MQFKTDPIICYLIYGVLMYVDIQYEGLIDCWINGGFCPGVLAGKLVRWLINKGQVDGFCLRINIRMIVGM